MRRSGGFRVGTAVRRLHGSATSTVAHLTTRSGSPPELPTVPINAELRSWGQSYDVATALREVRAGRPIGSQQRARATGPNGTRVCFCLDEFAA